MSQALLLALHACNIWKVKYIEGHSPSTQQISQKSWLGTISDLAEIHYTYSYTSLWNTQKKLGQNSIRCMSNSSLNTAPNR